MRATMIAAALTAVVLTATGCGKEAPAPAPAPGGNAGGAQQQPAQPVQPGAQAQPVPDEDTRVRHGGYTGALIDGRRHAMEVNAESTLRNEIKQFEQLEGHLPKSLDELQQWRGGVLPPLSLGLTYKYDPQNGELKVINAPEQN